MLSSRTHKTAAQGEGERLAFAVQPHTNAAQSRAQGEDRERKGEGGEKGKQEHLVKRKKEEEEGSAVYGRRGMMKGLVSRTTAQGGPSARSCCAAVPKPKEGKGG